MRDRTVRERHGHLKLDGEQVDKIRRLHSNGESVAVLAGAFDVTESAIRAIVTRKTWVHR
jgi:hypothetical protein